MHLRDHPQTHRTTTGATRSASSQHPDTTIATKSNKKSGFTLASPVVVAQEIDGEGDSDEWVSSESLSATPQNQSSDSESGDDGDDVVRNLPANLNLTSVAHVATSPDDREPPTPTVPQVKRQPPTQVNNVKVQPPHRLSTTTAPNEVVGTSAVNDDAGRHDKGRSTNDQESVGDHHHPQSDHHRHARPEEGLASTPRPRAIVDRDTEHSRLLLSISPSNPPAGPNSTAHEPSILNPRRGGDVQDRPQKDTLSAHPAPQSHPHITRDSPGPRSNNDPQGRSQITMTQVSEDLSLRIITKSLHA